MDETKAWQARPLEALYPIVYLWAYAAGAFEDTRAVVYDLCEARAGENAKLFLGD